MTADKAKKGDRRKYYGKPKGDQRGGIKGAGIFITTPRGMENRAVREAYDIFNDIAERLYPDVTPADRQHDGALRDTVEDAMEQELQRLQKKEVVGGMRFQSRKTQTDCLAFITVARPYDPVILVEEAVKELIVTRKIKSKSILRLTPVAETCYASRIEDIEGLGRKVLATVFRPLGRVRTENPVRYKINIHLRNHTRMDKMLLYGLFGGIVHNFVTEPNLHLHQVDKDVVEEGPANTPSLKSLEIPRGWSRSVQVDLENPEKIIMIEILRNTCGISVVNGPLYNGPGKRYNMDMISAAILEENERERVAKEGGEPKDQAGAPTLPIPAGQPQPNSMMEVD